MLPTKPRCYHDAMQRLLSAIGFAFPLFYKGHFSCRRMKAPVKEFRGSHYLFILLWAR